MASLVSIADGDWDNSATWGLVNAGSVTITTSPASQTTLTTSNQSSTAFTPGIIDIAGVAVMVAVKSTGTNTITLELYNSTDAAVAGTATIAQSDLPSADSTNKNGGWVYFKFPSTVTTGNLKTYLVRMRSSSGTNAPGFWNNGTAGTWLNLIVTTANQVPAAGDVLYVMGDSANTSRTVTFNETTTNPEDFTAATDYGTGPTAQPAEWGALTVSDGGIVTFANSASTNYTMRLSGNLVVFSGGEFRMGTSSARIPRTGTASLGMDNAANGNAGIYVKTGGVFRAYGESRTSGKNVVKSKLNGTVNVGVSTVNTVEDTGWKSGDEVVLCNTTRVTVATNYGWEVLTLSADAGASSFTTSTNTAFSHLGVAPLQGDVALLTRNVRIRSVGASFQGRILVGTSATFDCEWVDFRYLGYSTVQLLLLTFPAAAASNIKFCTLRNTPGSLLGTTATANNSITVNDLYTFDDNVFHDFGSGANDSVAFSLFAQNPGIRAGTFNRNIVTGQAKTSGRYVASFLATCFDCEGLIYTGAGRGNGASTITFNAAAYGATAAILQVPASGDIVDIEVYGSYNSSGATAACVGTINALAYESALFRVKAWNVNPPAFVTASQYMGNVEIVAYGVTALTTAPSTFAASGDMYIKSLLCLSDGTNVPPSAIDMRYGYRNTVVGDLITATQGSYTAPTADIRINASTEAPSGSLVIQRSDRTLVLSGIPANMSDVLVDTSVGVQRENNADNSAWTQFVKGKAAIDTTTYDGGSGTSMRVTPTSGTIVCRVPIGRVTVADGSTRTISLKALANTALAGYGTNYPRLVAKANYAVGLTTDTVVDTMTVAFLPGGASQGTWETLTGTLTATGGGNFLSNGQVQLYVECWGTAGYVNFDTLSVS
jgi:hypothetical protein